MSPPKPKPPSEQVAELQSYVMHLEEQLEQQLERKTLRGQSTYWKLASLNGQMSRNLWSSLTDADWWMMPILFPFVVVYGTFSALLALVLAVATLLDVPGFVARRICDVLMDKAKALKNDTDMSEFVSTATFPLLVYALCALTVLIAFVPTSPNLPTETLA